MPKKSKGANNTRRMAPKRFPIEYADSKFDQMYGTVDSVLGECHFNVLALNNEIKRCSLKGTLKRCGRIRVGDTVLIEPMGGNNYIIVFRYTLDQRKILEKEGHIGKSLDAATSLLQDSEDDENDDGFTFENENQGSQHQQNEELRYAAELQLLESMIDNIKK